MRILCICPIGIGNYLLCYPSWRLLRKNLPDSEIHLLALRKPILDLAGGDSLWNDVHCIDPTGRPGITSIISLVKKLRGRHFDVSMSFFPSNKWQYNLLPFLAGVRRRMAFRYHLKRNVSLSWLNSETVPVDVALHDVHQNIRLCAAFLGCDPSDTPIVFPELFSEAERVQAKKKLGAWGKRFFAVHPGSSAEHGMDAKRWPPERFGLLADRIAESLDAHALILGGSGESELKNEVASSMKRSCHIIEPLSLRLTAALLYECIMCLCNDSGIMHLAACAGVPTAAVFGPTDERRNGPYGNQHCIIRKPMEGFPLWTAANVGCRALPPGVDPRASLLALSVDDAWEMVKRFMAETLLKVK